MIWLIFENKALSKEIHSVIQSLSQSAYNPALPSQMADVNSEDNQLLVCTFTSLLEKNEVLIPRFNDLGREMAKGYCKQMTCE